MLSRLFKKKETEIAKGSFEKLNKNEIRHVVGGGGATTGGTTPEPVDSAIVKSKSNISNN